MLKKLTAHDDTRHKDIKETFDWIDVFEINANF